MKKEKIAILGSTGSIGMQAIDVLKQVNDKEIYALSCNKNTDILYKQILELKPKFVAVVDYEKAEILKDKLAKNNIKTNVFMGESGLFEIINDNNVNFVINALVGISGINPTIEIIKNRKKLALANKESLCCEGKKIMNLARRNNVEIRPIDSEHSAIWQCLQGEDVNRVERLIITCSGGPFYNKKKSELKNVSVSDCLKHPTWHMGEKISIDSATLVNKGFEIMEAYYLFGINYDKIDVIIQRQSLIHSMVLFKDASVKAQLGVASMKVPISYALYKNKRPNINEKKIDFDNLKDIYIDKPDTKTFEAINLAYEALKKGKDYPKKYCYADEKAVNDFINNKIKYLDIVKYIKNEIK